MINIIIKSVVIGIVSTAGIQMTYDIGNKSILAGINIAIIIGAFIAFKYYEESLNKEKLQKEENLQKFKNDLLMEVSNKNILENILLEIKDRTLAESILTEVKDRTVAENILAEVKDRKVVESILTEVKDKTVLENILSEVKDRTIVENILSQVKDRKILEDILIKIKDRSILEDIKAELENTNENIARKLDDNKNAITKLKGELGSGLDNLIEVTEENLEGYKEITNTYKELTNETVVKLIQIAKSNEHYLNLLKDTYKVLNVMVES